MASVNVTGVNDVGGIVGELAGAALTGTMSYDANGSASTVSATDTSTTGGAGFIVGRMTGASSINTGANTITVNNAAVFNSNALNAGGIVGSAEGTATLTQGAGAWTLPTSISVTGGVDIGGLVGIVNGTSLTLGNYLTNVANVSATTNVGGDIGELLAGNVTGAFTFKNTGNIQATTNAGGVVGKVAGGALGTSSSTIFQNTGMINSGLTSANSDVGGIAGSVTAGSASGTLINTGSVGTLNQSSYVGGIIGNFNQGDLSGATIGSAGTGAFTIAGLDRVGGLIGYVSNNVSGLPSEMVLGNTNMVVEGTGDVIGRIGGIVGDYEATGYHYGGTMAYAGTVGNSITPAGINVGGVIGNVFGSTFDFTAELEMSGLVYGADSVGGIIGEMFGSTTNGTMAHATFVDSASGQIVTATGTAAGGLVGFLSGGDINTPTNALQFTGSNPVVSGHNNVGFLFGTVTNTPTLTISSTLEIYGSSGPANGSTIGTGTAIGGLIGELDLIANNSLSMTYPGSVVGTGTSSMVGGVIGYYHGANLSGGTLTSNPSSTISGNNAVGGVIGNMDAGTLNDTMYLLPGNGTPVEGTGSGAGGFIGTYTGGSLSSMNATSLVFLLNAFYTISGANNVGALIGTVASTAGPLPSGTLDANTINGEWYPPPPCLLRAAVQAQVDYSVNLM